METTHVAQVNSNTSSLCDGEIAFVLQSILFVGRNGFHTILYLLCLESQRQITCDFEDPYSCGYDAKAWFRMRGEGPNPKTSPKADSKKSNLGKESQTTFRMALHPRFFVFTAQHIHVVIAVFM